jgi:hypothetical protein
MIEIDHIIPEAIDVFGSIRTERAQRVPIDDIESVKKSGVKRPEREKLTPRPSPITGGRWRSAKRPWLLGT